MNRLLLISAILAFLFGCKVDQRNIRRLHEYSYRYPNEVAKDCAKLFPVTESFVEAKKAKNKDYTPSIDSLRDIIYGFNPGTLGYPVTPSNIAIDSALYAERINALLNKISGLRLAIDALKTDYKPCKPDTIIKKIVDNALVTVWQNKYKGSSDSLVMVKTQLNQVKHSRSLWMWTAIGAIFLIVIYIVARVVIFFNGGGFSSAFKSLKA